jgi:glycine/D-amino acid oxidase-like deaminating enzyme
VIGAGAFGGWTALMLLRRKARVTLLDAWGPGNSRASSGGETRLIRALYGAQRIYTQMAVRAGELWRENEQLWDRQLYARTGLLWMVDRDDAFMAAALPLLREAGVVYEELALPQARQRYPQISFDKVDWIVLERDAGALLARRNCQRVVEAFIDEGGDYRQLTATPGEIAGEIRSLRLSDGSTIEADQYVFACGPWMGRLFPDVIGDRLKVTRQDVFFFGTPGGDRRFMDDWSPSWIERRQGQTRFYGIPANEHRGFKIADDVRGADIDPTSGDRTMDAGKILTARDYLAMRFPDMAGAPLIEARVCQYENTPDEHFIMDRHPRAANLWLLGGGSGHGYKHGPAVGERMAAHLLDGRAVEPLFAVTRLRR